MHTKTEKKTIINAPVSQVWEAITNPEMVKQYFAFNEVQSEWEEGGPITFTGVWEGKAYKDKGIVLKIKKENKLHQAHWSSLSGTNDAPQSYFTIIYQMEPEEDKTNLTITLLWREDDNQFIKQWDIMMEKLKELLEKRA